MDLIKAQALALHFSFTVSLSILRGNFCKMTEPQIDGGLLGPLLPPQAHLSVYIAFNTISPKTLEINEKPRDLNGSRGRTAEDGGFELLYALTCKNETLVPPHT